MGVVVGGGIKIVDSGGIVVVIMVRVVKGVVVMVE